jgi:ABC-type sulfate transport system permease component
MSVQVQLTLALAAVAVPINTLFGISAALLIARNNFPGKTVLLAILDLPFSISPVVTGLMLVGVGLKEQCWHVARAHNCGCAAATWLLFAHTSSPGKIPLLPALCHRTHPARLRPG